MIKNFSKYPTPAVSEYWSEMTEKKRLIIVSNYLRKNSKYNDIEILTAKNNGQITIKIEKIIPTNIRGIMLLELEEKIKKDIDEGLTIWCEPVGDKSKLRKLRGIEIKV